MYLDNQLDDITIKKALQKKLQESWHYYFIPTKSNILFKNYYIYF